MMKSFINNPQNLEKSIQLIRAAGRPYMFNKDFLIDAGFTESSAVLYNNLFVALGMVEANGKPGKEYGRFLESEDESKAVISEKIWEKYTEVFAEERHIYNLPIEKISPIFKKVYGDEHSDSFVNLMASTFKALVDFAGLTSIKKTVSHELVTAEEHVNGVSEDVFDELENDSIDDDPDDEIQLQEYEHSEETNQVEDEDDDSLKMETPETTADENTESLFETESETESGSKTDKDEDVDYLMNMLGETPKINDEKEDKVMDTKVLNNGTDHQEDAAEKNDTFLKKALVKRVELLQKLDRNEEAIEALDQLVKFFEKSDEPDKDEVLSKSLIQKAEILEKLGNDEKTLEAYDKYISRYFK